MLIVLSPAKTLDFDSPQRVKDFSQPIFLEDAIYLNKKLRKQSTRQLQKLMGISVSLAELNYQRNQEWSPPFTLDNARQAIFAFKGDVYTGLQAETLKKADLKYAQNHLRIISGLYGILKPLDLIQAYRLEMGCAFKVTPTKSNLYKYWTDRLAEHVLAEMKEIKSQHLLNLASNEYFKAIKHKELQDVLLSPQFKDYKNGEYKMISFFAKKARGLMAAFVIRNKISDPDDLRAFDYEDYSFNNQLSSEKGMVFTRG